MTDVDTTVPQRQSLDTHSARQLATTTKTAPQMVGITPRWILKLLPWVQVDSGTYRVNRKKVVLREGHKVRAHVVDGKAHVDTENLRAVPMFEFLDNDAVSSIAGRFVSEPYAPGDHVVEEGAKGDKFYIIARGKVEVTTQGLHGETLRLAVLADGDYFGEISLLTDEPRNATVRALTPCIVLSLPKDEFQQMVSSSPGLMATLKNACDERVEARQRVTEFGEEHVEIEAGHHGEPDLPETFVDYEEEPREYPLNVVQTIVRVHTRVSDIYNQPINQLREQVRLAIEGIKEKQEWELIHNSDFGLLENISPKMRVQPRYGPPTPDDMDELLSRVWKKPAFFLAHPQAIAAFGRECTARGVPPPTVQMYGAPFLTWRGVPLVPCDKLEVRSNGSGAGSTNILLMRVGEEEQGVVGLHQTGIPGEQMPSLSVRFMGVNKNSVASYLVTLYFSAAVLTDDALGMLENVEVGYYHDYS